MNRNDNTPVVTDQAEATEDEAEVEGFALGALWTSFTKGIEVGRNKEILNERADYWVANPQQVPRA